MVEARDKRTGMYVTEVGWSSVKGGNWLNLGVIGQASMINKRLPVLHGESQGPEPQERRLLHLGGLGRVDRL